MEHESDSDTISDWGIRKYFQKLGKRTGKLGNQRTSGHHPNDRIIKISQNGEKGPANLGRLAVTPVRIYQLTLAWKPLKSKILIIMKGDNYTNRDWCFWYSHQRIIKGTGGLRGRRTRGDYPNYSIIENGQNTEKSPGVLRRLAVTQTQLKDLQLKLMWKFSRSK